MLENIRGPDFIITAIGWDENVLQSKATAPSEEFKRTKVTKKLMISFNERNFFCVTIDCFYSLLLCPLAEYDLGYIERHALHL